MRVYVVVVVFLAVVVGTTHAQKVCPVAVCVGQGTGCPSSTNTTYICNDPSLYCNSTNVCSPLRALGEQCDSFVGCIGYPNVWCNSSQYCALAPSQLYPGQACIATDQCQYYDTLLPCPSSGVCPSNVTGQVCRPGTCTYGVSWCNYTNTGDDATGLCVASLPNGASCPANYVLDNWCASENCNPINITGSPLTCVASHSVPVGGVCGASSYCTYGSACLSDSFYGNCYEEQLKASYNICTSDDNCTDPEYCYCHDSNNRAFPDGVARCRPYFAADVSVAQHAYQTCYASHSCSDLTCGIANCKTDLCTDFLNQNSYLNDTFITQYSCNYDADTIQTYNACKSAAATTTATGSTTASQTTTTSVATTAATATATTAAATSAATATNAATTGGVVVLAVLVAVL